MKILAILASAGQARRSNALPPLEVRDVFVVVMQAHTPLVVCLHWRMRHESTDWRSSLLRARRNRTKAWDSVGFRLLLPDQQNASRYGPLLRSRLERISALVLRSTAGGSRHKTKASPEETLRGPAPGAFTCANDEVGAASQHQAERMQIAPRAAREPDRKAIRARPSRPPPSQRLSVRPKEGAPARRSEGPPQMCILGGQRLKMGMI